MPEQSRIVLGVITGAHGIQGEVKLKSFTADPEAIASYGPLDASNGAVLQIKSLKLHKDLYRARIDGVTDRNAAESLKGLELSITRDRLPKPETNEVYHADLVGLSVVDLAGSPMGTVVNILDFGAGELLELKLQDVKSTVLVPFNRQTVPDINLDAGTLSIDPPAGLLDDDTE
ncbi:MAG: ribosome maturation factor RimM [Anderseniella sp.]|jgi:16S rRNA processing protein RimM